jgi:hypothetical protein
MGSMMAGQCPSANLVLTALGARTAATQWKRSSVDDGGGVG